MIPRSAGLLLSTIYGDTIAAVVIPKHATNNHKAAVATNNLKLQGLDRHKSKCTYKKTSLKRNSELNINSQ